MCPEPKCAITFFFWLWYSRHVHMWTIHMVGTCVNYSYGWFMCELFIWLVHVWTIHMVGSCVNYSCGWFMYELFIWLVHVWTIHMVGSCVIFGITTCWSVSMDTKLFMNKKRELTVALFLIDWNKVTIGIVWTVMLFDLAFGMICLTWSLLSSVWLGRIFYRTDYENNWPIIFMIDFNLKMYR